MAESNGRIRMGVIGLGHWFERLEQGLTNSAIVVSKAIGTKSFAERAEKLRGFGIDEGSYYRGGGDGSIPQGFFDGIDAVYISSPNSLHCTQTIQSLEKGKYVIVEKTLATNKQDFDSVMALLRVGGSSERVYLHLHYLHKQLTLTLDGLLARLEGSHGKVENVAATFIEAYNDSDKRRKWLFSKGEGGIFMDWIHPYEVLFHGAKASSVRLNDVRLFKLNSEYGDDPSGVEASATVNGGRFAKNAKAAIRVGKGADSNMKRMRFYLEDTSYLDLDFINSEHEFNGAHRGVWRLMDGDGIELESGMPKGHDTSQIFAEEIVKLCSGVNSGLTASDIERLYALQWRFQEMLESKRVISDKGEIDKFIEAAMSCRL